MDVFSCTFLNVRIKGMFMKNNSIIKLAIANAIIEKLWIMGLLKDDERVKILERNSKNFT